MQESLKQQQPEAALAYESPQMRLVPVRCNASVLVTSETRAIGSMDNLLNGELRDFYYHGQYGNDPSQPGNTATKWELDEGWDLTF